MKEKDEREKQAEQTSVQFDAFGIPVTAAQMQAFLDDEGIGYTDEFVESFGGDSKPGGLYAKAPPPAAEEAHEVSDKKPDTVLGSEGATKERYKEKKERPRGARYAWVEKGKGKRSVNARRKTLDAKEWEREKERRKDDDGVLPSEAGDLHFSANQIRRYKRRADRGSRRVIPEDQSKREAYGFATMRLERRRLFEDLALTPILHGEEDSLEKQAALEYGYKALFSDLIEKFGAQARIPLNRGAFTSGWASQAVARKLGVPRSEVPHALLHRPSLLRNLLSYSLKGKRFNLFNLSMSRFESAGFTPSVFRKALNDNKNAKDPQTREMVRLLLVISGIEPNPGPFTMSPGELAARQLILAGRARPNNFGGPGRAPPLLLRGPAQYVPMRRPREEVMDQHIFTDTHILRRPRGWVPPPTPPAQRERVDPAFALDDTFYYELHWTKYRDTQTYLLVYVKQSYGNPTVEVPPEDEWLRSHPYPENLSRRLRHSDFFAKYHTIDCIYPLRETATSLDRELAEEIDDLLVIAGVEQNPGPPKKGSHSNRGSKGSDPNPQPTKVKIHVKRQIKKDALVGQSLNEEKCQELAKRDAQREREQEARAAAEEKVRTDEAVPPKPREDEDEDSEKCRGRVGVACDDVHALPLDMSESIMRDKWALEKYLNTLFFSAGEGLSEAMTVSFNGHFDDRMPTYNERDSLVTVTCRNGKSWLVEGVGTFGEIFVTHRMMQVAGMTSLHEDKVNSYRNILQAFRVDPKVQAEMKEARSVNMLFNEIQMHYAAFCLAGILTSKGKIKFFNPVSEKVLTLYTCPRPDDWEERLARAHIEIAPELLGVLAKAHRFARAAQFTIEGMTPACPNFGDMDTLIAGLCKRLCPKLPTMKQYMELSIMERTEQFCSLVDDYLARNNDERLYRIQEIIDHSLESHPVRDRERIKEGADAFLTDPQQAITLYKQAWYKSFPKGEAYPEPEPLTSGKPPRSIMSMDFYFRGVQIAAMGVILSVIEGVTKPCNVKHMHVNEITQRLVEKFDRAGFVSETDFSSFESCLNHHMRSLIEIPIFRHIANHFGFEWSSTFIRECIARPFVKVVGLGWQSKQFPHIRMSGDYWTSLGNLVSNLVITSAVRDVPVEQQIREGLFEGDDGVFPAPVDDTQRQLWLKRAEDCGVLLTFDTAPWKSLSFCGNHFCEVNGEVIRTRDSNKALANLTVLFHPFGASKRNDLMLQRAKCLSVLDGPWVPTASVFAALVERVTRTAGIRAEHDFLLRNRMLKEFSSYKAEDCLPQWLVWKDPEDHSQGLLDDENFCKLVARADWRAGGVVDKSQISKALARMYDGPCEVYLETPVPLEAGRYWNPRVGFNLARELPIAIAGDCRWIDLWNPPTLRNMVRDYIGYTPPEVIYRKRHVIERHPSTYSVWQLFLVLVGVVLMWRGLAQSKFGQVIPSSFVEVGTYDYCTFDTCPSAYFAQYGTTWYTNETISAYFGREPFYTLMPKEVDKYALVTRSDGKDNTTHLERLHMVDYELVPNGVCRGVGVPKAVNYAYRLFISPVSVPASKGWCGGVVGTLIFASFYWILLVWLSVKWTLNFRHAGSWAWCFAMILLDGSLLFFHSADYSPVMPVFPHPDSCVTWAKAYELRITLQPLAAPELPRAFCPVGARECTALNARTSFPESNLSPLSWSESFGFWRANVFLSVQAFYNTHWFLYLLSADVVILLGLFLVLPVTFRIARWIFDALVFRFMYLGREAVVEPSWRTIRRLAANIGRRAWANRRELAHGLFVFIRVLVGAGLLTSGVALLSYMTMKY